MNPKEIIQLILKRFKETIKPEEFNFSNFVTECDKDNKCGTVCCIVGWFPKIFPESGFYWEFKDKSYLKHKSKKNVEEALQMLIFNQWGGIEQTIIELLFYGRGDLRSKYGLCAYSKYSEIIKAWERVINDWDELYGSKRNLNWSKEYKIK